MKKHKGAIILLASALLFLIGLWPVALISTPAGIVFTIFDIWKNYYS